MTVGHSPWQNHDWRRITRKGHYTHWVCKKCGIKCQRDSHIMDLPPNANNLDGIMRTFTCEEVVVAKVMEA